jgi:hypothetical protein
VNSRVKEETTRLFLTKREPRDLSGCLSLLSDMYCSNGTLVTSFLLTVLTFTVCRSS